MRRSTIVRLPGDATASKPNSGSKTSSLSRIVTMAIYFENKFCLISFFVRVPVHLGFGLSKKLVSTKSTTDGLVDIMHLHVRVLQYGYLHATHARVRALMHDPMHGILMNVHVVHTHSSMDTQTGNKGKTNQKKAMANH